MRWIGAVAVAVLLVLSGCVAPTSPWALPDRPGNEPGMSETPAPDPEGDVLGWENGHWHDDPLPINATDGLNETELGAVVNRSMARVEYLRRVEFDRVVPVTIISRSTFRERVTDGNTTPSTARRRFENARSEALFLVGENRSATRSQQNNTATGVLGFYAPGKDRITIVSESETPTISEGTLGHELVHALQWGTYDMSQFTGRTIEARNTNRAVFEGDARYVDRRYGERCGAEWACVSPPPNGGDGDGGGGGGFHFGLYLLQYFPYSDGPGLIERRLDVGGWGAVADLYERPPASTEQVIDPGTYGESGPREIRVPDRSDGAWRRIPRNRTETVGQPGITAMLAYPAFENSRSNRSVVPRRRVLNVRNGSVDRTDPYDYDIPPADGWDGDEMVIYASGSETGYVWRLAWDTKADAREFATAYARLLTYWGGERRNGVWRIPEGESGFADAFAVRVTGSTVTIVNAPTVGDLDGVHGPVASWRSGSD